MKTNYTTVLAMVAAFGLGAVESEEYKRVIPIRDKSSNFRAYVIEGVVK